MSALGEKRTFAATRSSGERRGAGGLSDRNPVLRRFRRRIEFLCSTPDICADQPIKGLFVQSPFPLGREEVVYRVYDKVAEIEPAHSPCAKALNFQDSVMEHTLAGSDGPLLDLIRSLGRFYGASQYPGVTSKDLFAADLRPRGGPRRRVQVSISGG